MDFTSLLVLLQQIGLVSLVPIAGALGTWAVQKIKLQSLNIKGDTWEQTKLAIQVAVQATDQQLKDASNEEKKTYCMGLSKKLLNVKKIKFDDELLSTLIESQVWDKKNPPVVKLPVLPSSGTENAGTTEISPNSSETAMG